MASNVFTKKDILQNLASRGCFIDVYTLDAFFNKKKIEAIFEDSQGNEFYDQNALNVVLDGLFNSSRALAEYGEKPDTQPQNNSNISDNIDNNINNNTSNNAMPNISAESDPEINVNEAYNIINNISLSDGTPLRSKVDSLQNFENNNNDTNQPNISNSNLLEEFEKKDNPPPVEDPPSQNLSPNVSYNNEELLDINQDDLMSNDMMQGGTSSGSFDDLTLLSESFEAQEKLRQYVMSELSKNNMDMTPQRQQPSYNNSNNEFKLDISERTLNMIARTMAKKIAKYVGSIMAQDAKQSSKVAEYEEENRKLIQKARELEEQNRKLRLLLAESNKNLNSYKPSFFGLYKKVDPKKNKK